MKRVFTSHDSAEVGLLKSLLDEAGIECFTRNETQAYVTVFYPELWIVRDEDLAAAEKICREWRESKAVQSRWICSACGEELEGQFDTCWNCGATRIFTAAVAPAAPKKSVSAPEAPPKPRIVWKPFPDFIVILLAIAAFILEFYYRGVYLSDPRAALYYPTYTPVWFASQQMTLDDGWKDVSGLPRALWYWHEMRFEHDTPEFCEYVLRDALWFAQRSRWRATNMTGLRASLAVLLGEQGARQKCAQELNSLAAADLTTSNFVLAAQAVYGTNKSISFKEIDEPASVLGETWFRSRFEARWRKLQGNGAEVARLTGRLEADASRMQKKHLTVIGVATVGQALGLVALLWMFLARRRLAAFKENLVVPWTGWEGLGIVFAAWALGILLDLLLQAVGLGTISHFVYYVVFWTPLVWLLWQRHARHDSRPLKQLFSLSPMGTRGLTLIIAGVAVFLLDWLAYEGVSAAAHAAGLKSHWAEGIYDPELYEPWSVRWLLLLNGVLIGPIGEEILHRGVLFPALRKWFPVGAAALLSAVVFALPHYYSSPGFFALVAFGTVSALSVHFSGSLIPTIIGHVLMNLILLAGFSWIFGN